MAHYKKSTTAYSLESKWLWWGTWRSWYMTSNYSAVFTKYGALPRYKTLLKSWRIRVINEGVPDGAMLMDYLV